MSRRRYPRRWQSNTPGVLYIVQLRPKDKPQLVMRNGRVFRCTRSIRFLEENRTELLMHHMPDRGVDVAVPARKLDRRKK